jgi:hypothetical protein
MPIMAAMIIFIQLDDCMGEIIPKGTMYIRNARAGYRRHPKTLPYRCYLSILAGFERLRRAGPARTLARIHDVRGGVKLDAGLYMCKQLQIFLSILLANNIACSIIELYNCNGIAIINSCPFVRASIALWGFFNYTPMIIAFP